MRYVIVGIVGLLLGVSVTMLLQRPAESSERSAPTAIAAKGDGAVDLTSDEAIAAYAIGYDLSTELEYGLEQDGVKVDRAVVQAGFADGLADRAPRASASEMSRVLGELHDRVMAANTPKLMEADPEYRKLCEDNLAASKAYLAENAGKPGVKELEKGIQYEVIAAGDAGGVSPGVDDTVVCTYTGRLIDKTEFAEATEARVRVGDTTAGARLVLTRMKPGDHWRVVIPPELAHGPAGKPPIIGPNQALVFDVRLIKVEAAK